MAQQLDLFGSAAPAPARTTPLVVERSTSSEMSMSEFAQWFSTSFGGMSIADVLQQAAFMLCCDVIAQDCAKAKLQLREYLPNGTSRIVKPSEHPIAGFLADVPNERHTWVEFNEMMILWHCLTQNSHALIRRNLKGEVLAVLPWQTGRVSQPRIIGREVFYDFLAGTLADQALLGATSITAPARDVIHVRGRMLDGMMGFSTLVAGRSTLEAGEAIEAFRTSLFNDEGQMRGVFTRESDGILPEDAFKRLKAQLRELLRRFRQTQEPIVLEGGLKFQTISSTPEQAQLAAQFDAQIVATCRLLRVPPHKVFHLANVKYENLETMEKSYVSDTLIPVCLRHEERYKIALLSAEDRRKYFIQHDRQALQLEDTESKTDRLIRSLERGAISWDEYRAELDTEPLPNGQGKYRLVPANMIVVDEDGTVIIAASQLGDAAPKDPGNTKPKKSLRLVANND